MFSETEDFDVVLIRHAQSQFNRATIEHSRRLSLGGSFIDFTAHQEFQNAVCYNDQLIDANISEMGRLECKNSREIMKNHEIDLILVSPQIRALETCRRVFQNRKIPVIVEPLITQAFKYSCDVSSSIAQKKERYPDYDFEKLQQMGQDWNIKVLPQEKAQKVFKNYETHQINTIQDRQKQLLRMLRTGELVQEDKDIRERISKVKDLLVEFQKKHKRIGIVSHYHTIQFIKSKGFNEEGSLIYYQGIMNCKPYFEKLVDLLKIR